MIKVAYDNSVFILQSFGGISRYFCKLWENVAAFDDIDARIYAPLHYNRHLSDTRYRSLNCFYFPKMPSKLFGISQRISTKWTERAISSAKPDIVHHTYFPPRPLSVSNAKRIVTIYDMIHELCPQYFVNAEATTEPKRKAVESADHVICISENTRRDLIDQFGVPIEKTSVIYLGVDGSSFRSDPPAVEKPIVDAPYFLFVGQRGGYKNFEGFLHAFSLSPNLRNDTRIVCFGGGPITREELEKVSQFGLRADHVTWVTGGDDVLSSLYRQALAFVYPSLYEGFGIPILEAMMCDCPVILSRTSSLPEVAGDAGIYFAHSDLETLTDCMEKVLSSDETRQAAITAGMEQAGRFSWQACASETYAVYRGLK